MGAIEWFGRVRDGNKLIEVITMSDVVVKKVNLFSVLSSQGLVVTATDGSIDFTATLDNVQNRVEVEATEAAEWDAKVENSLNEIFDSLPADQRIARPLAVNLAVQKLGGDKPTLETMIELTGRIDDYLDRSVRFTGKRGRNGGLGREA